MQIRPVFADSVTKLIGSYVESENSGIIDASLISRAMGNSFQQIIVMLIARQTFSAGL